MSDIDAKAEAAAREIAQSRIKKLKEVLELSDAFGEFLLRDEQLAEHAAIISRHFAPLVEAADYLIAAADGLRNGYPDSESLDFLNDDAGSGVRAYPGDAKSTRFLQLYDTFRAAWTAAKDATP
jgi:hypothetical protein